MGIVVSKKVVNAAHEVFKGSAARGKGTIGWFYGFKLHIINHLGDTVAAKHTPANTDDRKPVRELSKGLLDKLYADKGYISLALTKGLKEDAIVLITTQRKDMKPKSHHLTSLTLTIKVDGDSLNRTEVN